MIQKEEIANAAGTLTGIQSILYFFDVYSSGIIAMTTLLSAIVCGVFYYLKHREQKRHNTEIEEIRRKHPEIDI